MCNWYEGTLRADNGRFLVEERDFLMSVAWCGEPPTREARLPSTAYMDQEDGYIDALLDARTYQVAEGRLELRDESRQTILVFRMDRRSP